MSSPAERRSSSSTKKLLDLPKIQATILQNKLLWIVPTILFTLLGIGHILTKKSEWKASQTLLVRDEAIGEMGFGSSQPLGRFESNDSLKRFLETVLQVSQNRSVVRAALEQVGPESGKRKDFPQEKHIEALIEDVQVSAPKGVEFGTSEVIYLSVSSADPQRAVALTKAMCDELDNRMRDIRNEYARSIITELQEKKSLAERDLQKVTQQLSKLEGKVGQDLGELRTLAEGTSGESNLRLYLNQIKAELRQSETQQDSLKELLSLLEEFRNDPDAILGTPNRLLESQPALRRLKDGLVDAQLRTARLRGGLTESHPRIQSALQNEKNVEGQLLNEVKNAVFAIKADLSLSNRQVDSLQTKLEEIGNRLATLASQRAPYVNLTSEVNQRREQVRQASVSLAEARGRQEASKTSSLITQVDAPVTGTKPQGPGRATLLLGSASAGLALGLSLVYLLAPWQESQRRRRRTDAQAAAARTAGSVNGRRASDSSTPPVSTAPPAVTLEFGQPATASTQSSS